MPFTIPTSPLFITVYALSAVLIVCVILLIRLEIKIRRILHGSSVDLESSFKSFSKELGALKDFRTEAENYLEKVERRLRRSVQGVETIRFNPFKGTGSGGNQSFATALINEAGDGVVISSLYSRDRVSVFSKPIRNFVPEFELSEEERAALKKAAAITGKKV